MAKKRLYFMVLDCETATLPFADELANNSEEKKKIAISKPLIYDIGWTICDRQGNIVKKESFLVSEIFSVPAVFNTAYYKDKRPMYLEKLNNGEIDLRSWREIMPVFMNDVRMVDSVGAFNSMFDFKKAIPFTDLYIKHLYSADYFDWEKVQYKICKDIISKPYEKPEDKEFDAMNFTFHHVTVPLFDLWGLATVNLLNNVRYKQKCLEHNMLTASGTFFKTSAESSYRYLKDKYDFDEAHTAIEDAEIETFILSKIARKHAISAGIIYFPFRELGTTYDFVMRNEKPKMKEVQVVYDAISLYIENALAEGKENNYLTRLMRIVETLEAMKDC